MRRRAAGAASSAPSGSAGTTGAATAAVPRGRRLRRIAGVLTGAVLLGLLAIGLTLWVLTRSWYVVSRAQPVLAELLGGDVTIERAIFLGQGRFDLEGVVVRARDLQGPEAEVARIGRAEVRLDARALRGGRVELLGLVLHDFTLRISESEEDSDRFNIAGLSPVMEASEAGTLPPTIEIASGRIELADHGPGRFDLRATRLMQGSLRPSRVDPGRFDFQLDVTRPGRSAQPDGSMEGLLLRGWWDLAHSEIEITLRDLDLDDAMREAAPAYLRAWWDHLELSGRVEAVDLSWSPQRGLSAALAVRDAGITMPIQTEAFWQWYRLGRVERQGVRPRMFVTRGYLAFSDNALELRDLSGRFMARDDDPVSAEIPYVVNLRLAGLPEFSWDDRMEWADSVARTSQFELEFQGSGLEVRSAPGEEPPAIILPTAVVDALRRFRLTEWTLSTTVRAARDAPLTEIDEEGHETLIAAPVRAKGQAMLRRARGAFDAFPYQMENVSATIEFTHEYVEIHELRGQGAQGSSVGLSGRVDLPGAGDGIHLQLRATNLPLDGRLRDALPEAQRAVFDAVLHEESVQRLASAGLLIDDSQIRLMRADAHDAYDGPESQARARLAAAGPFRLGGSVDVDMMIERAADSAEEPAVSGRISFDRLGLVYEDVPYPIVLERGVVEWTPARVKLLGRDGQNGIRILTAGGGAGVLRGEIDLAHEEGEHAASPLKPRLELAVSGDIVTPRLLAALPPEAAEREELGARWPGAALSSMAQQLQLLDFHGVLDYRAVVGTKDDGSVEFSALIDLRDGHITGASAMAQWLGGEFDDDAEDWGLQDVHASVSITPQSVRLLDLRGSGLGGEVHATGEFDIPTGDVAVHASIQSLPVSQSLLSFVPADIREDAERFFDAHQPEGRFSASAQWIREEGVDRTSVSIEPDELSLRLDGRVVTLTRRGGRLNIDGAGVAIEDLDLSLTTSQTDEGSVMVTGRIGAAGTRSDLRALWKDGRFASPLIAQLLGWFGSEDQQAALRRTAPDGGFTLKLDLAATPSSNGLQLVRGELVPRDLVLTLNERPLHFYFGSDAAIRFEPDRILVHNLHGESVAGMFTVDGTVTFGDLLDARFDVAFTGRVASPAIVAALPENVARAVRSLHINEREASRLTNGHVRFVRRPAEPEAEWSFSVEGLLDLSGLAMDIGLDLENVDGTLDFAVHARRGGEPRMRIDAALSHAGVLNQVVRDARFRLMLDDSARSILLRDLTGRLSHGTLVTTADIALRRGERHHVDVRILGAPVSDWSIRDQPDGPPREEGDEGKAYVAVEFESIRGDESSRTGRGLLRITQGRVAGIPFGLQLLQVLQLSFPVQRMEYAEADFFIVGSVVHVERMLMESVSGDAVVQQLIGSGEIDLDARELDLRFRSRGSMLFVRDLLGEIGDRMAAIHVTGSMDDPKTSLVPLPGREERSTAPVLAPPLRGSGRKPGIDPVPRRFSLEGIAIEGGGGTSDG